MTFESSCFEPAARDQRNSLCKSNLQSIRAAKGTSAELAGQSEEAVSYLLGKETHETTQASTDTPIPTKEY